MSWGCSLLQRLLWALCLNNHSLRGLSSLRLWSLQPFRPPFIYQFDSFDTSSMPDRVSLRWHVPFSFNPQTWSFVARHPAVKSTQKFLWSLFPSVFALLTLDLGTTAFFWLHCPIPWTQSDSGFSNIFQVLATLKIKSKVLSIVHYSPWQKLIALMWWKQFEK